MGGHIIGGSDVRRLHNKIRALNAPPASDTLENAEALFDTLEKVAGRRRQRSSLIFWAGYTIGVLTAGLLTWFLMR